MDGCVLNTGCSWLPAFASRVVEVAGGLLVGVGLANPGIDVFEDRRLEVTSPAGVERVAALCGRGF